MARSSEQELPSSDPAADTGSAQLSGEWEVRAPGSGRMLGLRFACLPPSLQGQTPPEF